MALQIAFKVINNLTGPDGLVLTLLVFKAYLKIIKSDVLSSIVT
jgi:hypothetical protein